MRVVAIVLAAGEGRRLGGPKALARIEGATFLDRVAHRFSEAGLEVIAVLGAGSDRVLAAARLPERATAVVNDAWRSGMLSSVLRGLDEAEARGADAVLLHPVDHPMLTSQTVAAVLTALDNGSRIAVACHAGRRGHPVAFARSAWPALRAAPLDRGARSVLHSHPDWIVHVETTADCLLGVNTPADLDALQETQARHR